MARYWKGLSYTEAGVISIGAVLRPSGSGPWTALVRWPEEKSLGDQYAAPADAQQAIEEWFQERPPTCWNGGGE